jgi:hypothetical protein
MNRTMKTAVAILALGVPCTLAAQGGAAKSLKPLSDAEAASLAPKVRSITAEPSTLTIHVGETVSLDRIIVTAIDSSGKARGNLIGYDFLIKPGEPASAMPRKVTGVRPGTADLVIRYPRASWKARTDPRVEAHVKVVVK